MDFCEVNRGFRASPVRGPRVGPRRPDRGGVLARRRADQDPGPARGMDSAPGMGAALGRAAHDQPLPLHGRLRLLVHLAERFGADAEPRARVRAGEGQDAEAGGVDRVVDPSDGRTGENEARMTIDAWMQHPTQRFLNQEAFESLRRWTGQQIPQDEIPIEATIAAMDAAEISFGILSAWHGPQGPLIAN